MDLRFASRISEARGYSICVSRQVPQTKTNWGQCADLFTGQRLFVNKTELIEHIANQADISKAAAGRALEAIIGGVRTTLKKGGTVSLVGFGSFAVTKRAARTGRNPRTGAEIKIKSAKIPKFRPGKALKDALN